MEGQGRQIPAQAGLLGQPAAWKELGILFSLGVLSTTTTTQQKEKKFSTSL
jgi:hypothetical protein